MEFKKDTGSKNKILLIVIATWIFALTATVFIGILIFPELKKMSKSRKKDRPRNSYDDGTDISWLGTEPEVSIVEDGYFVTDGKSIFFKNQYDNNRLYSYYKDGDSGVSLKAVVDTIPGMMYYYDGYIYYTGEINDRSIPGAAAIYRVKTDGSKEEMLTSLEPDACYVAFEHLADGKLYFSFEEAFSGEKTFYKMDLKSLEIKPLNSENTYMHRIERIVAATEDALYVMTRSGLEKFEPESGKYEPVIENFASKSCIIYEGYVYYTEYTKKYNGGVYVNRVSLDGSDRQSIYEADVLWEKDVKVFVLNNKVFILTKSESETFDTYGDYVNYVNIYSCELDGSNPELVCANVNLLGISEDSIYYNFFDASQISKRNTLGQKFENVRSFPTYKRDIGIEGEISEEYVFLNPEDLNKAWVIYNSPCSFYNPKTEGYYTANYFYYDENGELYKNTWKNIDGKNYYFGEDGRMYSQEYTPDNYFVGEDGTVSDFETPLEYLYTEYPESEMFIRDLSYYETGAPTDTEILDRGKVYELTNMQVLVTKTFSKEEVYEMKRQEGIYIKELDMFAVVGEDEGYNEDFKGECIELKQSMDSYLQFKLVKRKGSERYILAIGYNYGEIEVEPVVFPAYIGSVYLTKDAKFEDTKDEKVYEEDFSEYYSEYSETIEDLKDEVKHFPFYVYAYILDYDTVDGAYVISRLRRYR